jgi:beta-glucosidase
MAEYLTENGYEGAFSLEWEKKWHPELPPIQDALEAMLKIYK